MGENLCKECKNDSKGIKEQNLTRSENKTLKEFQNIISENKNTTNLIKTPDIVLVSNTGSDILKIVNPSSDNFKKNEETPNLTPLKAVPTIKPEKIIEEKVEVDKNELNKIINKYRINVIIASFKKLLNKKQKAREEIFYEKQLQEIKKYITVEGKGDIDVDLFPEDTYDYLGNVFNSKKDGLGIEYFNKTNSKYIGFFRNDFRIGWGKFEDKSKGYIYEGETKLNWTGKYGLYDNYKSKVKYEGEWLNNRKEGYGIESYSDNSIFKGQFHEGAKFGVGYYLWSDGSNYEGEWVNNSLEGYGIYKYKDGSYCSGMWHANQLNGFGKFTFPEIKCYVGFFEKDVKSGFGLIYWFNEPKAFIGYWKDNKQNGIGKFISFGNVRYGSWQNGRKILKYEEKEFYNQCKSEIQIFLEIFELDYEGIGSFVQKYEGL